MKKISANILDGKFEHLVDEDNLQITRIQIKRAKKYQVTSQIKVWYL